MSSKKTAFQLIRLSIYSDLTSVRCFSNGKTHDRNEWGRFSPEGQWAPHIPDWDQSEASSPFFWFDFLIPMWRPCRWSSRWSWWTKSWRRLRRKCAQFAQFALFGLITDSGPDVNLISNTALPLLALSKCIWVLNSYTLFFVSINLCFDSNFLSSYYQGQSWTDLKIKSREEQNVGTWKSTCELTVAQWHLGNGFLPSLSRKKTVCQTIVNSRSTSRWHHLFRLSRTVLNSIFSPTLLFFL